MKVLLIVWTFFYVGSSGGGVSQTTTLLQSMEDCKKAKVHIESIQVSAKVRGTGSSVTAECIPL